MVRELQSALRRDMAQIRLLVSRNPAAGYARMVEIGRQTGVRYGLQVIVNFPHEKKIKEFEMYGKRDLSIIVDKERRRFPISRSIIKEKAREFLGDVAVEDAYMYEGKEGARVRTADGRIDILPHSLHVWAAFDRGVTAYCDWLMENVYGVRLGDP